MKKYLILCSIVLCIVYSSLFLFICSFSTKEIYTYQVGVYKEEKNKNEKMKWLNEHGLKGYSYKKNDHYYVISLISDSYNDIQDHSMSVKGVIKKYEVNRNLSIDQFIDTLKE